MPATLPTGHRAATGVLVLARGKGICLARQVPTPFDDRRDSPIPIDEPGLGLLAAADGRMELAKPALCYWLTSRRERERATVALQDGSRDLVPLVRFSLAIHDQPVSPFSRSGPRDDLGNHYRGMLARRAPCHGQEPLERAPAFLRRPHVLPVMERPERLVLC
jgi:hypothetical protein